MALLRNWSQGGVFEITPQSVKGMEAYIRWAEVEAPHQVGIYMDQLVQTMALVNQMYARRMSFGPYDPQEHDPSLAWRTPEQGIRRISQAYYLGWKVYKIGFGHYRLQNASREAYFIEFGISQVGFGARTVPARRIRRPVRKLSQLKMLEFMKTTTAYHRIWTDMFRARHTHGGFTQIVQSPGMGSFTGPMLGRYLPG